MDGPVECAHAYTDPMQRNRTGQWNEPPVKRQCVFHHRREGVMGEIPVSIAALFYRKQQSQRLASGEMMLKRPCRCLMSGQNSVRCLRLHRYRVASQNVPPLQPTCRDNMVQASIPIFLRLRYMNLELPLSLRVTKFVKPACVRCQRPAPEPKVSRVVEQAGQNHP
jgi:hypothetical protein